MSSRFAARKSYSPRVLLARPRQSSRIRRALRPIPRLLLQRSGFSSSSRAFQHSDECTRPISTLSHQRHAEFLPAIPAPEQPPGDSPSRTFPPGNFPLQGGSIVFPALADQQSPFAALQLLPRRQSSMPALAFDSRDGGVCRVRVHPSTSGGPGVFSNSIADYVNVICFELPAHLSTP